MPITYLTIERRKKNLKQSQLAKKLGTSQCHLSSIETLRFKPGEELKTRIEDFFKMSIEELLTVISI